MRSHINTAIYVVDFLKHAKAHDGEKRQVEELIGALTRLLAQVWPGGVDWIWGRVDVWTCG